ncbi:PEP-CTERM/exosortase system-associated acyltransferase [Thiocystis violacea]|uniref:PEP-CTERM/exosortase system-associated acyltransferase n=1 Tax=Thiocystis violacea TaxID=13725 RepID=UPI001903BA2E
MVQASIAANFGTYFELKLATTPELLAQVYQVRYEVYCKEFGYLAEEQCPGQMEQDEYDERAQHALMIHRQTQLPVGCIRLVRPEKDGRICLLPFETFCATFPEYSLSSNHLPRQSVGEMSRLAVVERFRRRKKDDKKPISMPDDQESEGNERRSNFPMIPVGLFTAGMSMFLRSSTDLAFALMEPRLARLLQRFGIMFTQAGEAVDHFGLRAPFALPRKRALGVLLPEIEELFTHIDAQLFGTGNGLGADFNAT